MAGVLWGSVVGAPAFMEEVEESPLLFYSLGTGALDARWVLGDASLDYLTIFTKLLLNGLNVIPVKGFLDLREHKLCVFWNNER